MKTVSNSIKTLKDKGMIMTNNENPLSIGDKIRENKRLKNELSILVKGNSVMAEEQYYPAKHGTLSVGKRTWTGEKRQQRADITGSEIEHLHKHLPAHGYTAGDSSRRGGITTSEFNHDDGHKVSLKTFTSPSSKGVAMHRSNRHSVAVSPSVGSEGGDHPKNVIHKLIGTHSVA